MTRPTCPECESDRVLTIVRAFEKNDKWGNATILECAACEHQWKE